MVDEFDAHGDSNNENLYYFNKMTTNNQWYKHKRKIALQDFVRLTKSNFPERIDYERQSKRVIVSTQATEGAKIE